MQKVSDRKMRQGLRPVAWPDSQAARTGIKILFKKPGFVGLLTDTLPAF
jgi:hypothetical protein